MYPSNLLLLLLFKLSLLESLQQLTIVICLFLIVVKLKKRNKMKKLLIVLAAATGLYAAHNGDYRAYSSGCHDGYCNFNELAMAYIRGMEQDKGFDYDAFDRLCADACISGKYVSRQEFERQVYGGGKPKNSASFVATKFGDLEVKKSADFGNYLVFNKKPIGETEGGIYHELQDKFSLSGGEAILIRRNLGGTGTPNYFLMAWITANGQVELIGVDIDCDILCIKPKITKVGDAVVFKYKNQKAVFKNGVFSKQ